MPDVSVHRRAATAGPGRRAVALGLGLAWVAARSPAQGAPRPWLTVRFAPEKDYGPFIYQSADGRLQGLSIDVLQAIAEPAGLRLDVQPPRALADILRGAQAGEVDLVSSLRPTPERATYLGFTRPYVNVPVVLVARTPRPGDQHLSHWGGRDVAVGRGYAVEAFVRERYPQVRWQAMDSDTESLQALLADRVQGVVADLASVRFAQREHDLPPLTLYPDIGFEYPLSFAWRKDWPELGLRLDEALRQLPEQRRQALRARWLDAPGQGLEPGPAPWLRRIGLGLGAVALLGFGIALARPRSRDDGP